MTRLPAFLLACAAFACSGDDDKGLCGGSEPPATCTDAAGTWQGTWEIVGGDYDGMTGSYEMTVAAADCAVSGMLSIAGESATLSGQMCTETTASLLLTSDLGRGTASATIAEEMLEGNFTVTITRPATSIFDPVPGTYSGVFEGVRVGE